jgi:tetratricopeptide (TPR) repeat protein
MTQRCVLIILAIAFLLPNPSWSLSIRVLPGGIPVGSPEQLIKEGLLLGSTQHLRQAWKEYAHAVQLDPKFLEGYLQLGRLYFHLSLLQATGEQDYLDALSYARRALELAPGNGEAHRVMAMVLSGRGEFLEAMDEVTLAFSLNPSSEFVLCDMAAIHMAMHQPQKTVELLEGKGLRNGWSYFILSLAWLQKGERGRALINLKKAERLGFTGYWTDLVESVIQKRSNATLPYQNR